MQQHILGRTTQRHAQEQQIAATEQQVASAYTQLVRATPLNFAPQIPARVRRDKLVTDGREARLLARRLVGRPLVQQRLLVDQRHARVAAEKMELQAVVAL